MFGRLPDPNHAPWVPLHGITLTTLEITMNTLKRVLAFLIAITYPVWGPLAMFVSGVAFIVCWFVSALWSVGKDIHADAKRALKVEEV